MKKQIVTIFLLLILTCSFGQNSDIKVMVDSLRYLKADTLDCSAGLYWRIVAKGDKAIPFLIDKLTDTTQTQVRFHCKRTKLNVGEISQFALGEIAEFPAFLVTKMQFDVIIIDDMGKACWSFYDFLFENSNKLRYQKDVKGWYDKQRLKYTAVRIPKTKQTDCQRQFGINTYYKWTE